MPVTRPTVAQVRALADDLGFTLSDADAQSFLGLMAGSFAAYDAVAAMPDHVPAVRYPRTPGYRPEGAENRYNAWYVKTTVKGTQTGKLAGKTIVLKDNVCLAGVPMMNGASTLEGYVPDVDATIVTRMLDAGGTIVGKAHCEYFCFSGGSHTCAAGPVHNPRKPGYSAGGSSSGSAALVAAGEVDMAIGGDQGGSIRIPASYCGIYGMKPTHGLVPYTGIMPIELTLDHAGPMTATVADNALLLEVLAGADGLDPRQYAPRTAPCTEALGRGLYVTSLIDAHSAWRRRADELSDTLKLSMLLGHYFVKHHRGHFYAKAQNLSRKLRDAYDAALADFDVLVMPTLPLKATPLPPADAPREVSIQRAFEMISNTAPFDATGHPAMSVPCGQSDGLPIGLMLIGKHWEESTIYRAAHAFEQAGDWRHV